MIHFRFCIVLYCAGLLQCLNVFIGLTRYYEVDGGRGIPAKAHRIAQNRLGLGRLETKTPAVFLAVSLQGVDVARQAQPLPIGVLQHQLQQIAAALGQVRTLDHVDHTLQSELSAGPITDE